MEYQKQNKISIPIIIDNDSSLKYETNNFCRRIINVVLLHPIFNILSENIGTRLIAKSKNAIEVKKRATTYHALEIMYTYENKIDFSKGIINGLATFAWLNLTNPKALRNRLKLVKKEIKNTVYKFNRDVNILSLGSGSARAIIETLKDMKDYQQKILVKLLDKDILALDYSKKLANDYGVYSSYLEWINDKISNFRNYCVDFKPDIIEMVGVLDYLDKEKAVKIISNIYQELPNDGILITCNIKDNSEREFVTEVVKWPMIYRDEEALVDVILAGGFELDKIKIIYEPFRIHGVVIAKKNNF